MVHSASINPESLGSPLFSVHSVQFDDSRLTRMSRSIEVRRTGCRPLLTLRGGAEMDILRYGPSLPSLVQTLTFWLSAVSQ